MVFWRVHALYLSADSLTYVTSLSVVSYDGNSAHANKCVTAVKVSNFSGHYLRNRSTLDIGVLGYIGIL